MSTVPPTSFRKGSSILSQVVKKIRLSEKIKTIILHNNNFLLDTLPYDGLVFTGLKLQVHSMVKIVFYDSIYNTEVQTLVIDGWIYLKPLNSSSDFIGFCEFVPKEDCDSMNKFSAHFIEVKHESI